MCIIEVRLAKRIRVERKKKKTRPLRRKQKEKKKDEEVWPESTAQLPLIKVGITFDGHRKMATASLSVFFFFFSPILFVKSERRRSGGECLSTRGFRLESNTSRRPLEGAEAQFTLRSASRR